MDNEKEVNPAQPEEVEVSLLKGIKERIPEAIDDGGATAPAPSEPQDAPASVVMIACKTCGAPFARTGANSKYCETCSAGRKTVTRQNRNESQKASTFLFHSNVE